MMASVFVWGKYAAYIWPAYGISLAGIAAAVLLVWRSYYRAKRQLAELDSEKSPSGGG